MSETIINKRSIEIDQNSLLDNSNKDLIRWYNDCDHFEKVQCNTTKESSVRYKTSKKYIIEQNLIFILTRLHFQQNRKTDDRSVVGLSAFIASPKRQICKSESNISNRQFDSGPRKQINATDSSSTLCSNKLNEVAKLEFQDSTDSDNFIKNYIRTYIYSRTRLARVDERKLMASVLAIHGNKNDNEIVSEVNSIITSKRTSNQKNIGKMRKLMTKYKTSSKKPQTIERVTATRNFVYEIEPIGTEIKSKEKTSHKIGNQSRIKRQQRNDDKELKCLRSSPKNDLIQSAEYCSRDLQRASASLPKLLPKNLSNVEKLQTNIDALKQMITLPTIESLDYKMKYQGKNCMHLYTRNVKNDSVAHPAIEGIKNVKLTRKLISAEVSNKKDAANETISYPTRGNVSCQMTNYRSAQNRNDLLGNANLNSIEMQIPKNLLLKILKSEYLRKDLPMKKNCNKYFVDSYSMD
ncbi:uncharacterized protein LOC107266280 isoform X2 [Cephus cinctus]|uniref:Uncharacterized protein LOC107266280 isoform X2 n=1 Tax=Cephus cinctus TaxID=211228 RepID=A0AAJ7FHH1_CEPCN|nr:uncharacterized protein LOC107266280 isoform X2 [Cephus cinctus]